jgi:hypothetical protein
MENQTSQQVATFSIQQAKELINQCIKISHPLWNADEFITKHWRDGYYQNEEGKMIDASKFWNYRFEDGYVIWKELDEDDFMDSED